MARAGRRRDDEISVSELLRETGATPRSLGEKPPDVRTREDDTGEGYRERLEQRAREAAAGQQRAGRRIRWIFALGGAVVVLGSLVLIAVTSEGSPERREATAPGLLAPATTTPRTTTAASPTPSPTPMPTVLRQTSSVAAPKSEPPPVATCVVRFAVKDRWNDGFTAEVTITNKGSGTLSPWTLGWTFTAGQRVTHGWDGKYSQRGDQVTVTAESWNTTLAPGASVTTGFNGALDRGNPAPGGFTLNGSRCDAA
jgi:hypothetical protein